jgi:cell filamentation protein
MTDPYVYPGTNVLINKEDIRDAETLARFERMETANRIETLPSGIPLTADGFRTVHRHIFHNVYEWAGQIRTVDIAKNNDLFCRVFFVERELEKCLKSLRAEDCLRGLSPETFAQRAAFYVSELNAIHPFREGNGRTTRAFLGILGEQAGHRIEMQRIDPEAWIDASRESFRTGECRLMYAVIAGAIA